MKSLTVAIRELNSAYRELIDGFGWKEMMHAPKDGTEIEVIELGSTGIHRAVWVETGPTKHDGDWFVGPDGDCSNPVLWRPCA